MDKLIYNSGFGILPKAVMIDPNLSLQAKGIFAYLVTYAGNSETAFPSQKTISYQLRISKDTVGKYIKELRENGYLEIEQKREGGRFSHNVYKLIPCPKIPYPKKTDSIITEPGDTEPGSLASNINNNNINNNNICIYTKENLSSMSKLYQENIGLANGIVGEYIIEISDKIEVPLFKRAIEICTEKGNNNLGYLKGIIKKWLEKNITTLEQLKAYELQNKKQSTNSIPQSNKFIPKYKVPGESRVGVRVNETFNQYDPDELEKLLRESQKGKF